MNIEDIVEQLTGIIEDNKGENIKAYKCHDTALSDYIIVASASNFIHCRSLQDYIIKAYKEIKTKNPKSDFYKHPIVSGTPDSGWVILDLNAVVVHVIEGSLRDYYELDPLFEQRGDVYHY